MTAFGLCHGRLNRYDGHGAPTPAHPRFSMEHQRDSAPETKSSPSKLSHVPAELYWPPWQPVPPLNGTKGPLSLCI